jgi:DNA-directed RNA polymerase subunit RPC12/RpoP
MSIIGYTDLQCPACDGKRFVAVSALIWKDGAGVSPRPTGWVCFDCEKQFDADQAIRAVKRQHLIEKQKELENSI